MLEFLFGVGVGILIGTKYNCKPYVEFVLYTIKNTLNDIKNDFKHENNINNVNNENIVDEILLSTMLNNEIKKEN